MATTLLTPRTHGYLDYAMGALFAAAPLSFGFTAAPAIASYVVAATIVGLSLFTRYPLGAVRLVPFTIHGDVEFATAPLLVSMPWIAGFSREPLACTMFVGSGVVLFLVWLMTDYRAADR
jgi:hypothetical protein